jgi:6-phosphogluconolactonase (cycloisomerase 2 family)
MLSSPFCRRSLPALALVAAGVAGCTGQTTTGAYVPTAAALTRQPQAGDYGQPEAGATMYLASRSKHAIVGFARTAQGDATPTVVIAGRKTHLHDPVALAVDRNSGTIYAANDAGQTILVFPAGASGNATAKVLGGSHAPIKSTEGIAIDAAGHIYVSDYLGNAIYVFAPGATGNAVPIHVITGSATQFDRPTGMAFDKSGNLYVTNSYGSTAPILEFAVGANGNVAPIATIGGSNTGIDNAFNLSIDAMGRIVVPTSSSIEVFAAGAKGNVAPVQVISGSMTMLAYVSSVGSDAKSNIYATTFNYYTYQSSVLVFGPYANGNVAPTRTLAGAKTKLDDPFYPTFY